MPADEAPTVHISCESNSVPGWKSLQTIEQTPETTAHTRVRRERKGQSGAAKASQREGESSE